MPLPFEERDGEERVSVYLEQIERAEDPPPRQATHVRVARRIDLKVVLVLPVLDQHAVKDRGGASGLRADRVIELPRPFDRSVVADECRTVVPDTDEDPGTGPRRFEDVVWQLRLLADRLRTLRHEVRAA